MLISDTRRIDMRPIARQVLDDGIICHYGGDTSSPGNIEAGGISSEECSRSYLGRSGHGVITSYNYPFDYLHNLTCTYTIHVTSDPNTSNVICFTFHRFSLESSTPFCSFDYLKLEYPNLKYCAHGLWMYGVQTTSSGSNVWSKDFCWPVKNKKTFDLTFSSDNNINGAGFYAEFFIYPGVDSEKILPPGNLGQAPCSVDEWTCFNRRCIDKSHLCDGTDDCGDRSDESYTHARCGEQNVLACDFTSGTVSDGYCGFTHEGWYRTNEQHSPYGPSGDHTNGTSGYYVYSDVNQSSAFLLSPELSLPRNKTYCLSFWYYIYGRPAAAILRVYITRDQAYSKPEWSRSSVPENVWAKGEIAIHSKADIQVIFAAELDNSFSGVALDDMSILPGQCLDDDRSCNFESGTCNWNITTDIRHNSGYLHADLRWTLHSRQLGPTGPAWDHSSKDGGGYYLYLNNTSPPHRDNIALLVSLPISSLPGKYRCLHFWYHMSGQDRDCCHLQVRVYQVDNSLTGAVWNKMGDVRSAWKEAFINLNIGDPFQLVIQGAISTDDRSQIAIDQILLSDGLCSGTGGGACEAGQYLCGDGQCINGSRKCNGIQDCIDNSDEDWRAACPTPSPTTTSTPAPTKPACPHGEYQCQDGACIADDRVCDHYQDCSDGSDETDAAGCPTVLRPCRSGRFLCQNGRCIPGKKQCDHADNCGDNSDELNCTVLTTVAVFPVCGATEFMCREDHMCIPQSMTCDDNVDCSDSSDESEEFANCGGGDVLSSTTIKLGTGAIAGLVVGSLVCVGLIVISAFLGRKRRKPRPRHHRRPQRSQEISTITDSSTIERHMSMLESLRSPMRMTGLPPYSGQNMENMGYTSDGTATLRQNGPAAVVFPPEEPPPPYDSVIKENTEDATHREINNPNTPESGAGPSASGAHTPEDDSYGFRSRSRPGSSRSSHRRSQERLSARANQNRRREEHSVPVTGPSTPGHSSSNPSDESDSQNIYEELSVPTLRPNQLRQEPSSSSTLQPTAQVSVPLTAPGCYSYKGPPCTKAVTATIHQPPVKTIPHQRIRLGTQALHSRPPASTYRPRNYYSDQGNTVLDATPRVSRAGYEPLDPPGPYHISPHQYTSPTHPGGHSHAHHPVTLPESTNSDGTRHGINPAINTVGRHSQKYQRHPDSEQPTHRLYGSSRNPPRNYGTTSPGRLPYQLQTECQPTVQSPTTVGVHTVPHLAPNSPPMTSNSALSPRAMPSPKIHRGHGSHSVDKSVIEPDSYLYRPRVSNQNHAPGAAGGSYGSHPSSAGSANHSRDWNNSSFASTGSQEQLLGSPPAGGAAPYPHHPRADSNISSDIDSTSPLVASRDEGARDRDLEILTPTAV
ncbi:hypothetical protein LSH36_514g00022 [Paralvinella palmiformis]|uniref:Uncharacterized protein n=1 Tax=Paralvinella palmiformis TaxID=53620 RepID=A0AAD9MXS4_9ANNE|nr:hypothetical protein LSH36_514g00022 [Paralvinella palmiformis]